MPSLIIFDMDGVLLDSEPMHRELNQQLFREVGADVSDAQYETFIGMGTMAMWETVITDWNLPFTAAELQAREHALKHESFRERPLTASVGLVDLLRELRAAGRKLAVASGSPARNIAVVLDRLNLVEYFDYVRSSETVARGKPHPDLFLAVAEHFGIEPAACAVIEDSANGIRAARAAGMPCIGYANPTSGRQDLSAAHLIVDSFHSPSLRKFLGLVG